MSSVYQSSIDKQCTHCGRILPVSSFHKHASKRDGLASWCRHCVNAARAARKGRAQTWRPRRTPASEQERVQPGPLPGTLSIPLTRGKWALIDAVDYDLVRGYVWSAHKSSNGIAWYAMSTTSNVHGQHTMVAMHRVILGAAPEVDVDHCDMDGLNNTRANLRLTNDTGNNANKRLQRNSTSGYKGVTWHRQHGKWYAQIVYHRRHYFLGLFDSAADAARAYDTKARELFAGFARCNFPLEDVPRCDP